MIHIIVASMPMDSTVETAGQLHGPEPSKPAFSPLSASSVLITPLSSFL